MEGLFIQHSPAWCRRSPTDFKDGAGFGAFVDYPQVGAVIANMEEKRSLVERFEIHCWACLDQRGRIHEAGNQIKGAPFQSLLEYNEARARGGCASAASAVPCSSWSTSSPCYSKTIPTWPDVFDTVTRKGRSQGVCSSSFAQPNPRRGRDQADPGQHPVPHRAEGGTQVDLGGE